MIRELQIEQALRLPKNHPARFVLLYGGGGRASSLSEELDLELADMVELEARFLAAYKMTKEVLP